MYLLTLVHVSPLSVVICHAYVIVPTFPIVAPPPVNVTLEYSMSITLSGSSVLESAVPLSKKSFVAFPSRSSIPAKSL